MFLKSQTSAVPYHKFHIASIIEMLQMEYKFGNSICPLKLVQPNRYFFLFNRKVYN